MTEHTERDGPGRRDYDKLKCPNCDVLWNNLEKERAATREHICGKILEVRKDVEDATKTLAEQAKAHAGFVPRWMFLCVFGALITVAGWWFNALTTTVKDSQHEVKETVATIHRRISETDNSREALKDSLYKFERSVDNLTYRLNEVEKKLQ